MYRKTNMYSQVVDCGHPELGLISRAVRRRGKWCVDGKGLPLG